MGSKTTTFSPLFDAEHVKHVKEMESSMYCVTMIDLRRLAFDLVVRMNIAHSFDATSALAGVDWAMAFIRRHTTLAIRRPIATSIARMEGFNKEAVGMFFGQYRKFLVNGGFVPIRIWNCDETGFTNVASEDDDEWPCLVCGEPFRSSRPGESWIHCQVCQHWLQHVPKVADFMFAAIASLIVSERVVRQQIRRTLQSVPYISPMIAPGRRW